MNKAEELTQFIVDQVELRNISVTRFCRELGIKRSTFYAWKNKNNLVSLTIADKALHFLNLNFTLGKEV